MSLPRVIPPGGVELKDQNATPADGPLIIVQPATPSSSDVSAATADVNAAAAVGPDITSTVFGIGTMPASEVEPGTPLPWNAVVDRAVWIVTISNGGPIGIPGCATISCPQLTNWIVVLDGVTGQPLIVVPQ